jgi:hypothetical protein
MVGVSLRYVAGLELVSGVDAARLLTAFRDAGARVVGAEGFRVEGEGAVRPAMDAILDLSSVDDPEQSIAEAERFVASASAAGLWFEFAVRDSANG